MGTILDATILHHVGIMLLVLWILNYFNCCYSVVYILGFIYLCFVHEVYVLKLRKKLQFEEKKESNRRRVLSDSETVRWLNYTVEKIWPICMEEIVSQKMLLPVIPWFLQKYKPWTVRDVAIQHLYLGRSPPTFTDMRVVQQSSGDDNLVLELGMNFRTADDMSAILGVRLRKRLGFGMLAKLHLLGLHVEGKVLVGVKFLRGWPFISRLRVCFVGPPYFQMTVKPIFTHGLDVTELPGIAGWIDNLLALVFEQTLVEPNMLVVDVEKFVSPQQESWFSIDEKEPIAHAIVEVLEAAEMNPSDLNGLADPYVKGQLGPYRFRTKTHNKTLTPKWHEEFKIPICTWESPNMLAIEVRDKDYLFDDMMGHDHLFKFFSCSGECSINLNELRDGQRHDMWLPLQNIKMGRLHLAFTVSEVNGKGPGSLCDVDAPNGDEKGVPSPGDSSFRGPSEKSPRVADRFEPVDIDGQAETGVWIHQPGSEVAQVWEPRKGKTRKLDSSNLNGSFKSIARAFSQNDGSSTDESMDGNKPHTKDRVLKGLKKIGSAFHRSQRSDEKSQPLGEPEQSPRDNTQYYNIEALNARQSGVKLIIDETGVAPSVKTPKYDAKELLEECGSDSPNHRPIKDAAKGILKQAGKSARGLRFALSGKGSRKSKVDSGSLVTDKDGHMDEDSSADDSFSPITDAPGSTVSPLTKLPAK